MGPTTSSPSPLVSIVIPTYNRQDFLPACIDSALAQDYPTFEVIVVDDGSTDGTPALCARYGDRIRYFSKPNGGAASALNFGIARMRGSWFKWLSSDDELEPGGLTALMAVAERSSAGVVYGDYVKIDRRGKVISRHRDRTFGESEGFVTLLWWHFVGNAGAAVIRRKCFDKVGGFDESLRYAEDYDWWLRAALLQRVRFEHVPAEVARYRVHPGQITREKLRQTEILREQIKARTTERLKDAKERDPRLWDFYLTMTRRYARIFRPLVSLSAVLSKAPGAAKADYWAGKLAPRFLSMVYWASDPPLGPSNETAPQR